MKQILQIGLFDLKRLIRDGGALFQMLVFPIIFIFVFGMAFSSSGTRTENTYLIITNSDQGPMGEILVELLSQEDIKPISLEEAGDHADRIHKLDIPPTFSTDLFEKPPAEVNLTPPGETSFLRTQKIQIAFVKAQIRTLAALCRTKPDSSQVFENTEFIETWNDVISEPNIVKTVSEIATRKEAPPTGFEHQIPGNIVMFVMMVLLVNSAVQLVVERNDGSFQRLLASPVTPGQIIAGKTFGRILPAIIQVFLLFLTGKLLFKLHLSGIIVPLMLLSLAYCFCAASMGLTIGMWFDDRKKVVAVGVPVTLALAAFGGCWWPIEIVGPFMQKLAMAIPTGWAMRGYHEIISFGYGIYDVLDNIVLLVALGILFIWIASRKVRIVS